MSASKASRFVFGRDGFCSEHRQSRHALEESLYPENTKPLTLIKGAKGLCFLKLVGRGNLKRIFILLKFKIKSRFNIRVEYHLEYRVAGFEPGTPDC